MVFNRAKKVRKIKRRIGDTASESETEHTSEHTSGDVSDYFSDLDIGSLNSSGEEEKEEEDPNSDKSGSGSEEELNSDEEFFEGNVDNWMYRDEISPLLHIPYRTGDRSYRSGSDSDPDRIYSNIKYKIDDLERKVKYVYNNPQVPYVYSYGPDIKMTSAQLLRDFRSKHKPISILKALICDNKGNKKLLTEEMYTIAISKQYQAIYYIKELTYEQIKLAISKSGNALYFMFDSYFFGSTLIYTGRARNGEIPSFIKKLTEPQKREIYLLAVNSVPEMIRLVENKFLTDELIKLAVEKSPCTIRHIKHKQTPELVKLAVGLETKSAQFVKNELLTKELCEQVIKKNPLMIIKLFKSHNTKISEKTINNAIEREPYLIVKLQEYNRDKKALKNKKEQEKKEKETKLKMDELWKIALSKKPCLLEKCFSQTKELCKIAFNADSNCFQHIRHEFQNRDMVLKAVTGKRSSNAGRNLKYARKDLYEKDHEICLNAVKSYPRAIKFVPVKMRTKEICDTAVRLDPKTICYVNHQTEQQAINALDCGYNSYLNILKIRKKTDKIKKIAMQKIALNNEKLSRSWYNDQLIGIVRRYGSSGFNIARGTLRNCSGYEQCLLKTLTNKASVNKIHIKEFASMDVNKIYNILKFAIRKDPKNILKIKKKVMDMIGFQLSTQLYKYAIEIDSECLFEFKQKIITPELIDVYINKHLSDDESIVYYENNSALQQILKVVTTRQLKKIIKHIGSYKLNRYWFKNQRNVTYKGTTNKLMVIPDGYNSDDKLKLADVSGSEGSDYSDSMSCLSDSSGGFSDFDAKFKYKFEKAKKKKKEKKRKPDIQDVIRDKDAFIQEAIKRGMSIEELIAINGLVILQVSPGKRTDKMYKTALETSPEVFRFLDPSLKVIVENKTEYLKNFIRKEPDSARRLYPEIFKEFIKDYPNLVLDLIKKDGSIISEIDKPSYEMCMCAIENDPKVITLIDLPTEEMIIKGIKKDWKIMEYIGGSSKKICDVAFNIDQRSWVYFDEEFKEQYLESIDFEVMEKFINVK